MFRDLFSAEKWEEAWDIIQSQFGTAVWETVYVTLASTAFAILIGLPLGVLLVVGDKKGIRRFGYFVLPMDESNVICSLDLSGRPYYVSDCRFTNERVGYLDTCLVDEFFYAVSYSAGMNLHFKMLSSGNDAAATLAEITT